MAGTPTRNKRGQKWTICTLLIASLCLPQVAWAATGKGIDVSHHQGRIRWGRVAKAGVDFAFIKASEGVGFADPRYRENRKRAASSGIRVGAYHFARPSGAKKERVRDDARREANYFLNVARPKESEMAPVLDLETSGDLNRAQLQRWTQAWLKHVRRKTGQRAIVYSGPLFWNDRMKGTARFAADHPLWLAHYTRGRPDVPAGFWGGRGWTFWQFTDCGRVRGVRGCVDVNVAAHSNLVSIDPAPVRSPKASKPNKRREAPSGPKRGRQEGSKKHKGPGKSKPKSKPAKSRKAKEGKPSRSKPRSAKSKGRSAPPKKKATATTPSRATGAPAQRGPRWPLADHPRRRWTRRV